MRVIMWHKILSRGVGFSRKYVGCGNLEPESFITGTNRWFRSCTALGSHSGQDKVVKSQYPAVEIPNITYPQFVFNQLEKFRDKPFLINGETGKTYSYHSALREISRVASSLIQCGLRPGDKVAFYSFNCPEYVIAFFAVTALGAVAVDANPNHTAGEFHQQLKATDARFIFSHWSNIGNSLEASANLPGFQEIFVFGKNAEGCRPYSVLTQDSGDLFKEPVAVDPMDTVHMPFSSGTTGLPKAVLRTHRNLVASAYVTDNENIELYTSGDTGLMVLPMFHLYANFLLGTVLLEGSAVVFQEKFSPEKTLEILQKYKVSYFPVVPPLVSFLCKHPLVEKFDLSSLKRIMSGAAPLSVHEQETVAERLKLSYMGQGYGMTEMCPVSITPRNENDYTSCGKIVCNTEVKVLGVDTGEELEVGVEGELYVKGPHIMSGYDGNLDATSSSLVDRWLRSGDIGWVREDSSVFVVDRLKDFIKVKGHQVAPAVLEALLKTHPVVQDVAVIGVQDERCGEVPRAFVVLKNKNVKVSELAHFVAERTSEEKHLLGGIVVLDEIPKSASGKILKKELRKL